MNIKTPGFDVGTLMGGSSSMSGFNSIYSNIGQSKMIASGAYMGLLKNYYKNYDSEGNVKSTTSKSNSTSADDTKTSNRVKSSSEKLASAADALRDKKLYEKVKTKDADGNEKEDYNYDDLYKKVSAFVDEYNSAIDAAGDSNTRGVLSAASKMTRNTSSNASMLAKVGIQIGSDNKLKLDEKSFRSGDMNALKTLFQGAGSYGYQTSLQASMMKSSAQIESSKTATYGPNGAYSNNYSSSFSDFI